MEYVLNLYSTDKKDLNNFLNAFYENDNYSSNWEITLHPMADNSKNDVYIYTKRTTNPVDFVVLLGALIDNDNKYNINAWLSLDKGIFINITNNNINSIIKYIYERFPY